MAEQVDSTNPLVTAGSCGVTTRGCGGGRYEWVCISKPHGRADDRQDLWRPNGQADVANRHHFVRRWPGTSR